MYMTERDKLKHVTQALLIIKNNLLFLDHETLDEVYDRVIQTKIRMLELMKEGD